MPQPHSFTSPRLLVTIPSHFLNFPPKTLHARVFLNFTASPIQDFLLDSKSFFKPRPQNPTCKTMPQLHRLPPSKSSCHDSKSFFKPPHPKPCMQEYASTSQLHLSKTSCHHSKACFKPPPPKPCMQECPKKKKHADSCGFIRDYRRFHRTRSIWLPT